MTTLKLTIKQRGEQLDVIATGDDRGVMTPEEGAMLHFLLMVLNDACEYSMKNGVGMSTTSVGIKEALVLLQSQLGG
jgi:hypothetical protein